MEAARRNWIFVEDEGAYMKGGEMETRVKKKLMKMRDEERRSRKGKTVEFPDPHGVNIMASAAYLCAADRMPTTLTAVPTALSQSWRLAGGSEGQRDWHRYTDNGTLKTCQGT
ncbi:hypothetical protein JOB18_034869 [Solea senegalensis]|uniref:Uncharacterized protein n=1 Tax=Solea senegalensis TaxID=28829 RepID=A0AAV6TAE7_SOLSE|nr:hypothetical protein JOB18_034869 [Solea senegalensis]